MNIFTCLVSIVNPAIRPRTEAHVAARLDVDGEAMAIHYLGRIGQFVLADTCHFDGGITGRQKPDLAFVPSPRSTLDFPATPPPVGHHRRRVTFDNWLFPQIIRHRSTVGRHPRLLLPLWAVLPSAKVN